MELAEVVFDLAASFHTPFLYGRRTGGSGPRRAKPWKTCTDIVFGERYTDRCNRHAPATASTGRQFGPLSFERMQSTQRREAASKLQEELQEATGELSRDSFRPTFSLVTAQKTSRPKSPEPFQASLTAPYPQLRSVACWKLFCRSDTKAA